MLSIKWNDKHYHFGIKKSGEYFTVEELLFDNIIQLISFYFTTKVRLIIIYQSFFHLIIYGKYCIRLIILAINYQNFLIYL